MNPSKALPLLVFALVAPLAAHSVTLYKYFGRDGRITYSDQPPSASTTIAVVPIEIDLLANTAQPPNPRVGGLTLAESNNAQIITRRPPVSDEAPARAARQRLEAARGALVAAQESATVDDWIYFGAGRGRAPRPEYEARLASLEARVKAAEADVGDEERRLRLGY